MNPLHPLLAFSLLLPLCRHSMASDAVPAAISTPKPETPRQAIEQFLGLTAIWMLEMEWTHAYANKTPKAEDFRNAMLAAGLQQCPADFQEAWLRQTAKPGRNYAAPVLRKYGVSLDRPDLTIEQWLEHLTEELLDGAGYAQSAIREIKALRAEVLRLRDENAAMRERIARSVEG